MTRIAHRGASIALLALLALPIISPGSAEAAVAARPFVESGNSSIQPVVVVVRRRAVVVRGPRVVGIRPWVRRPHYGRIVAGVALGTVIAATAYALAPTPPAPDLCWNWSDSTRQRGYWDYCN